MSKPSPVWMCVANVVRHFGGLEDPKSSINRPHPLLKTAVSAVTAKFARAIGSTVANSGLLNENRLLNLPNCIPKNDVYRRAMK